MGRTLSELASRKLPPNKVFNHRFVVEMCETMHVHYRGVRLLLSKENWVQLACGFRDSFDRWLKMGEPEEGGHVELCRKDIAAPCDEEIKINLNENLYLKHKGQIFAEGNELEDKRYIHFKFRDIRLEMSMDEFSILADAVDEAKKSLEVIRVPCEA